MPQHFWSLKAGVQSLGKKKKGCNSKPAVELLLGRNYKGVFEKYLGWIWNVFDFTL
jgi:hypothetical protein